LRSLPSQSCSTRYAPLVPNRPGLTFNVGQEGRVVLSLQPHFDEGPEDDLQAHREFERGRCLPRQDPSPVQDDMRENEEDFRLIRDHHHSLPAQLTPDLALYRSLRYITYISYIIYILYRTKSS
jgi:hypothetical protein